MSKIPITVVVPPRPEHKGFWSLGRTRPGKGVCFLTGQTDIEVTPEELAELKQDAESGFLAVVEYSPAERAARLAAKAAEEAQKAEAEAELALVAAQDKADAAKKAKALADKAAEAAVEKPAPAKGGKSKAQPEGDSQ